MAVKKAKPVVEDSDKHKKKRSYPVQRNVLPPEDFSKFDLLPENTGFAKLAGMTNAITYLASPDLMPGRMVYGASGFCISYRTDRFIFEGRLPQFLFYLVQLFHHKVRSNMTDEDIQRACVIDIDLKNFMHVFDVNDSNARKLLLRLYRSLMDVVVSFSAVTYFQEDLKPFQQDAALAFHILSGHAVSETSAMSALKDSIHGKIVNSRITFILDAQFGKFLSKSYVLWFPQSLYMVSPARYPNVLPVAMTIFIHFRMRYATLLSNCVGVDVLLDNCMGLPHSEADFTVNRSVYRRAVLPLIKALDALVKFNVLSEWEFIDSDRRVVDVKNLKYLHFHVFRTWSVIYILKNYPAKSSFNNLYDLLQALGSPSVSDFAIAHSERDSSLQLPVPLSSICDGYVPDYDPLSDAQSIDSIDLNANRDDDDFFISDSLPEGNLPDMDFQMTLF